MSSGVRRYLLTAALALGAALSGAHADTPIGLDALMARFHALPSSNAHFTERKFLSILSAPLESSGTLGYTAPDQLEKTTLYPDFQRLSVRGDTVVVDQGNGQSHNLSLKDSPEVEALIASIRATLSGDTDTLKRFYDVALKGSSASWELTLIPKLERMKGLVRTIRIAGREASIHVVETEEQGGDRSIMTIVEDTK